MNQPTKRERASTLECFRPGRYSNRSKCRRGSKRARQREMTGPYCVALGDFNIFDMGRWSVTTVTGTPSSKCAIRAKAHAKQHSSSSGATSFFSHGVHLGPLIAGDGTRYAHIKLAKSERRTAEASTRQQGSGTLKFSIVILDINIRRFISPDSIRIHAHRRNQTVIVSLPMERIRTRRTRCGDNASRTTYGSALRASSFPSPSPGIGQSPNLTNT
ncbi:hypothetical protein A4X13_0g8365 [Tilletia indica]|uniref:Uncharacterized protein n=1 Tax=Tilletia indica TaxID=43049 RepID=A0A8T8SF84_9BASI|nr:hypothetical protein A4X13_0g8365 [Tilletia indica]